MEVISNDSITGITGIRVYGLPNKCKQFANGNNGNNGNGNSSSDDASSDDEAFASSDDGGSSGSGSGSGSSSSGGGNQALQSFTITYTVCPDSSTCAPQTCAPLVAYHTKKGCVSYELATPPSTTKSQPAASAQGGITVETSTFEVYPNPFEKMTNLKFSLNSNTHVTLKIYDLTGVEVATLFDDRVAEWEVNTVEFRPEAVSDGTYYARLVTSDGQLMIRKLVLVR